MGQAHTYLEEHQIQRLLESLLARAALERPPDLRKFLAATLTEMKKSKGRPSMGIFTNEDLETMFDMWDVHGLGKIPTSKVGETLRALNCRPSEQAVQGPEEVDKPTFMKIVRLELEAMFSSPA